MPSSAAISLVNPWGLVAGIVPPGGLPTPPAGAVVGVAGGVVVACAVLMAPATTSLPAVARAVTAEPDRAVVAAAPVRTPPQRLDARAPAAPRATAAPRAPVRRQPAAAKRVRMLDARVTSGFGMRSGGMHEGLDLAAPIGTPIRVPLDGTVISAGPARGFGRWVRVRHADGTITVYGHVNRALVTVGERVRAGDVIAEVGNRGRSTGPHLHIEVVRPGGRKVDPRRWLNENGIGYRAR